MFPASKRYWVQSDFTTKLDWAVRWLERPVAVTGRVPGWVVAGTLTAITGKRLSGPATAVPAGAVPMARSTVSPARKPEPWTSTATVAGPPAALKVIVGAVVPAAPAGRAADTAIITARVEALRTVRASRLTTVFSNARSCRGRWPAPGGPQSLG